MAGDWLKIRVGLNRAREVLLIAEETGRSREEVVGWLISLWGWVSEESKTGDLPGVQPHHLIPGCPGHVPDMSPHCVPDMSFLDALRKVGWIEFSDSGMRIPNWERWNGETVKARAYEAERKRQQRLKKKLEEEKRASSRGSETPKCPGHVPDMSQDREEKRREEKMMKMEDGSEQPEARLSEPASPPFPPPPSPAVSIPTDLAGLELYEIDGNLCRRWAELRKAWEAAYPAVDILAEVKRAHAWEVSHPKQRKINRPKYLGDWLAREQDRGGRRSGAGDPLGRRSSFAEEGKFSDARFK